jgi:chaperonin GroEL
MMSERTPGGLLLPDNDALDLVRHAPWPPRSEEPSAVPNGLRIDAGYLSPYFVTHPDRFAAELDDPLVLVAEQPIARPQELVPILENVARTGRALLIIATAIEDEVLALLVLNKLRGILRVCAIAAKNIESIAHHLRCKVMRAPFERLSIKDLGTAKHVNSGMKSTIIERVE